MSSGSSGAATQLQFSANTYFLRLASDVRFWLSFGSSTASTGTQRLDQLRDAQRQRQGRAAGGCALFNIDSVFDMTEIVVAFIIGFLAGHVLTSLLCDGVVRR
jgi:hypothetical protein